MEKMISAKKVKRQRKHGFLLKMVTHKGRKVIKARRSKGRKSLSL